MKKPTVAELTSLARALACNAARQDADIDDLTQEALWSARRRLRKTPVPRNAFALARTVMQRAIITYYAGGWRGTGVRYRQDFPLTEAPPDKTMLDPQGQWDDKIDLDGFLNGLETKHGSLARTVAENLVTPQDPAYCQLLRKTATRKTALHRRGARTHAVKHIKPSHKQLRTAFNLSRIEWHAILLKVRQFAAVWLITQTDAATLPTRIRGFAATAQ